MREFFIKYFGRILAIFGCSTVVTACYGTPYSEYGTPFNVKGRVVDAETEQPIKDIKVRIRTVQVNSDSYPYSSSMSTLSDGSFILTGILEMQPSAYTVECIDVDGDLNGSYKSVIKEISYEQSHEIVIKMTPEDK